MSASVVHLAHAGPLLGTEDSTISRLVPGVTTEFLKGVETEAEERLLPLIELRFAKSDSMRSACLNSHLKLGHLLDHTIGSLRVRLNRQRRECHRDPLENTKHSKQELWSLRLRIPLGDCWRHVFYRRHRRFEL